MVASLPKRDETERLLLLLLVRDATRLERVGGLLEPEDFRGQVNRELYTALQRLATVGDDPALFKGTAEARALYDELKGDRQEVVDPEQTMTDTVAGIRLRPELERLAALREALGRAEGADQEALLAQFLELDRSIKRQVAEHSSLTGQAARSKWRFKRG